MHKIRTFFTYILIACSTALFANTASSGPKWITVKSIASDLPIEGVSITVNNQFAGTTGPLGKIRIIDLKEDDIVSFYHTSYAPRHFNYKQLERAEFVISLYESILNIQEVVIKANRMKPTLSTTHKKLERLTPNE